jgi:hypothetical protein
MSRMFCAPIEGPLAMAFELPMLCILSTVPRK